MVNSYKPKKTRFYKKLSFKMVTAISLSVLLIQIIFIAYIDRSNLHQEFDDVKEQQKLFTEATGIYLAELISENNEESLYLILSAIVANPLLTGGTLTFTDGSQPIELGEINSESTYSLDIRFLDEEDNIRTIGQLTTYATLDRLKEVHRQRYLSLMALVVLVFFAIVAVTIFSVQRYIGSPLQLILRAMEMGQNGKVPTIKWNSTDEIGIVVERLNYLHSQLTGRVTDLQEEISENERRESARISTLANATLEGILFFNDDIIIDMNERMATMLGNEREILIDQTLTDIFNKSVLNFLNQPVANRDRPSIESTIQTGNGVDLPVTIHLTYLDDDLSKRVAVVRDISERLETQKTMWQLAHYDSLTGLPNRRHFTDYLDNAIGFAQRNKVSLSVAYLDLDNFKLINDTRGHAAGDELLCAIADAIKESFGNIEATARLGGDEFALIIEDGALLIPVEQQIDGLLVALEHSEACQPWRHLISTSIGVATLVGEAMTRSELLMRADLALYKAKESGKSQVCYYTTQFDHDLKRKRTMIERLVGAIDNDQLELHYQPQVRCSDMTLSGYEALLRWNDPVLGQVPADELIAMAEQEQLMSRLGRWVIDRACRDGALWPSNVRLAINLSPNELSDNLLVDFVKNTLARTNMDGSRLEIELTETALVTDAENTLLVIERFKELGITIALDDFGTGHSSLSMLHNFPFDRIKIDRSFVSNLDPDGERSAIVTTVIELGKRLDLEVVAEGVESQNDIDILKSLDCSECQGFFVGKPMPVYALADWSNRHEKLSDSDERVTSIEWRKAG